MLSRLFKRSKELYQKQNVLLKCIFIAFVLLYLINLIYCGHDVLSLAENIDNVSITIKASRANPSSFDVYRITRAGLLAKLNRTDDTWKNSKLSYFKKILVSFPKGKAEDIKEIKINIGDKAYKFSGRDLSRFKSVSEYELLNGNGEKETVEIPGFVRGKKSLLFVLNLKDVINWGGDLEFFAIIIKRSIAGFLCLLFLIFLLSFKYPKAVHIIMVFFISLIIVGFFSVMQVDPHHDGIMLKPAVDFANGKMLFRDTFYQYGALTAIFQASAIKLLGERLIVIRLLTVLF